MRKEQCLAIHPKDIEEGVVVEKKTIEAKKALSREGSSMMSKHKEVEQCFEPNKGFIVIRRNQMQRESQLSKRRGRSSGKYGK